MGRNRMAFIVLGALAVTFAFSGWAYTAGPRDFEVVTLPGSVFPEFQGITVSAEGNELFLYAYRAKSNQWQQISFQFDERNATGSYFLADDVKGLDANDELSFLYRDAGDRNVMSWIDDQESHQFVRQEICLLDPLTKETRYVYLFRSHNVELSPNLPDYVKHSPSGSANPGEDSIETPYYHLKHGANGLPQDLSVVAVTGNTMDLLDRIKVRAHVEVFVSANITENSIVFEDGDGILIRDGMIRAIRQLDVTLNVNLGFFGTLSIDLSTPPAFYNPYSSSFALEVPSLSNVSVTSGRLSVDLNESAMNMRMVNAKNPEPGLLVDGKPDEYDNELLDDNWIFVGGSQGALVYLFPLDKVNAGSQILYYKDDAALDDGDTGDQRSFADVGPAFSDGINTAFTLSYEGFYLTQQSSDIAKAIAEMKAQPLQPSVVAQRFGTVVPVELVSFQARVNENNVALTWATASELNNFGFEIERRSLATSNWRKIGFAGGNGTTPEFKHYQFEDLALAAGEYSYRLKQIDLDGSFEYSAEVAVRVSSLIGFTLEQNYPNPFNPSTRISYHLPEVETLAKVSLIVYNLLGEQVRLLLERVQPAGSYTVEWDSRNDLGIPVPSGVYIYRLHYGTFNDTKKMLLLH